MKQSQRVVKNVLAGGVATTVGGALQMAAIVLVARSLPVADFGTYSLLLGFTFVLARLADLGLGSVLMREIAVRPHEIHKLLGAGVSLSRLICCILGLSLLIAMGLVPWSARTKLLSLAMGAAGLVSFMASCYGAALRSREDNELHALCFILHRGALLLLFCAALWSSLGLPGVVCATLAASVFQCWFFRILVVAKYGRPDVKVNLQLWRYLLLNAAPVGGAALCRLLAEQMDIVALRYQTDLRMVGLFSGSYKLVAGLRFAPQAAVIALFPIYSRSAAATGPRPALAEAYERSIKCLLICALPIASFFMAASEPIAVTVLGASYRSAAPIIRSLSVALVLLFLTSAFPLLLTALHEQTYLLKTSAFALISRGILDVVFIHWWGPLGPCIALIVVESLLLVMWMLRLSRLGCQSNISLLWKPCCASILIAVILYPCRHDSIIVLVSLMFIASTAYMYLNVKLGTLSPAELRMAKEGVHFIKPFLAQWSPYATRKTT